jgi:hypothetical protein
LNLPKGSRASLRKDGKKKSERVGVATPPVDSSGKAYDDGIGSRDVSEDTGLRGDLGDSDRSFNRSIDRSSSRSIDQSDDRSSESGLGSRNDEDDKEEEDEEEEYIIRRNYDDSNDDDDEDDDEEDSKVVGGENKKV